MMTVTVHGREPIAAAQVIILAGALRLYLRTGMKPNRAYTPTNMRAAASRITGVEYPRGRKGLELASAHLDTIRDALLEGRPEPIEGAN
jgi:hypothetical protein